MLNKTVCVVGLGYIGLPTAALLASNGYSVLGTDLSQHAVETINQGNIHIVEPDLDAFVRSAVTAGRLKAFTTPQRGDIYIACQPRSMKGRAFRNRISTMCCLRPAVSPAL